MKKITVLKAKSKSDFLSETIDELPTNCIFDKGKVGAGGTTLALKSRHNFVIAVPFKNLIINKVNQFPDGEILGVDGNTTKKEIINYITNSNIKKIMVTYDSLEKLTNYINPNDFNLLIDEYHLLFTQYSFRKDAAQSVLKSYTKYKSFCFMTATILEDDFILDELIDIPIVKMEWENVKEVEVQAIKCLNGVNSTTSQIIKDFLNGVFEGNAYLFVNSVDFIKEMIKVCNLTEDNCRVIYSSNNKTQLEISRGNTLDTPKKINFLTSTAFEGCDIYDEEGHTFVISDNRKQHTLVDISTSLQQIAGRIRNSKYSDTLYHIFTHTRYDVEISYEDFKEICEDQIVTTKSFVNKFNTLFTDKERSIGVSKVNDESAYITKEGNTIKFDPNRVKIDLYNFKITKCIYKLRVNMKDEYIKAGFVVSEYINNSLPIKKVEEIEVPFQELIKKMESNKLTFGLYEAAYIKYPWLKDAINKLGFDRIKQLRYSITKIKQELITSNGDNDLNKIAKLLKSNNKISNGVFISSSDLKNIFMNINSLLDIKKTAKASDITKYYEVEETIKKINGKSTRGYVVIKSKIIIK